MVGSVWGLKPKLMHWLYVSVVRPAMAYGSLAWWTKVDSGVAVRRLASVQRLACLLITGAMSSCPGATLNCILDLLPIDIFIKESARRGAYRLQCEYLWMPHGEPHGHARITREIKGEVLDMPSDHLPRTYTFGKSFQVCIPKREDWDAEAKPLSPGDRDWFTDGSKGERGTGAGICELNEGFGLGVPMGLYPTVFQAEVTAIMECAWENLRRGYEGLSINIFSDSQAAIKALDSCVFGSRTVWDCYKVLSCLGRRNNVTLCWVPGHSGIGGNERADRLANAAASKSLTGPQPFCAISRATAIQSVSAWARQEHRRRWAETPLLRVSKLNLRSPSKQVARNLLSLGRQDIRRITGMVTGHAHLRKHLSRLGVYNGNPVCRKCGLFEETADHLLFDCRELDEVRASTLGFMERGRHLPQEDLIDRMQSFVRSLDLNGF